MKRMLIPLLFLSFCNNAVAGADISTSCQVKKCYAGDQVISYATKKDPFFACSSMQLSEYTNTLIGLIAMTLQFTGHLPNISDTTGEPIFQGETKKVVENLRSEAGVQSFDQALQHCMQGSGKRKLIILNFPESEGIGSMYVSDPQRKISYWMPKGAADPKK